jgi:putative ABC transport system ATP-binding protein
MAEAVRHDPSRPPASRGAAVVVRAERLAKTFAGGGDGGTPVAAVRGVDLEVVRGELVAITGPSGSGKSTLLHLLGGITRPTRGRVLLEGADLATLDDDALAVVRRRRVGFVFQRYNLVPELTLLENAALPLVLDGVDGPAADAAALAMLDLVGVVGRAGHRPDELSGGEQQRGAIARALVARPAIVLADEPTGALDSDNSRLVVGLLQRIAADQGQTVVVVTHEPAVAAAASRTIRMRDGAITPGGAGRTPATRTSP